MQLALRSQAQGGYPPQALADCTAELTVQPSPIRSGMRFITVRERDGQLAGFHALRPAPDADLELLSLFVDPPDIGQGRGPPRSSRPRAWSGAWGAGGFGEPSRVRHPFV